jgi:hypothetical protein
MNLDTIKIARQLYTFKPLPSQYATAKAYLVEASRWSKTRDTALHCIATADHTFTSQFACEFLNIANKGVSF